WPPPFYGGAPVIVHTERAGATSQLETHRTWVSPDFFRLMRIAPKDGRVFTGQDLLTTEPVAVIDERLAQALWPSGGAIGSRVRLGTEPTAPWRTVVGIVTATR